MQGLLEMPDEDKVEIEWFDAYEMSAGWHDLEDVLKVKLPIMKSLGYVVKETKDSITICADKNADPKEKDRGRCQIIPKGWIKKTNLL